MAGVTKAAISCRLDADEETGTMDTTTPIKNIDHRKRGLNYARARSKRR